MCVSVYFKFVHRECEDEYVDYYYFYINENVRAISPYVSGSGYRKCLFIYCQPFSIERTSSISTCRRPIGNVFASLDQDWMHSKSDLFHVRVRRVGK